MGKKKVTYNKEESVEFRMMNRHHGDPLYYDTKANPKIFVPVTPNLTEKQMQVVESFPAEDRGEILDDDEYKKKGYGQIDPSSGGIDIHQNVTSVVELDQFEAAAKRHKLKEDAARIKRDRKAREQSGKIDFKDDEENPYDSEEKEYDRAIGTEIQIGEEEEDIVSNSYDSEFENEFFGKKDKDLNKELGNRSFENAEDNNSDDDQINSSQKQKKQDKYSANDYQEDLDLNRDMKRYANIKAAEGVEFVKYDILGNAILKETNPDDKDDIRNYLAKEGDDAGFDYVAPNDEQMKKVLELQAESAFTGGLVDIDKKVEKMTVEEKAVFDCLEDEKNIFAGEYEELDDDFLLMLNDGKPALELAKNMKPPPSLEESKHENAGVEIIKPEDSEHPMMIANYKEKMADVIAMLDKQNELRKKLTSEQVDYKQGKQIEQQAKKAVNQKALDDVFSSFMDKEYKDEQIGDLEGDEGVDPLAFIEGLEDEDDMIDYGEQTDGEEGMSQIRPSQQDMLEEKLMQDHEVINEAVDEFIQDKHLWFRKLHKEHGEDYEEAAKEKGAQFMPNTAKFVGKGLLLAPEETDPESIEFKKVVREKTIENAIEFQKQLDAKPDDYESPVSEEDPEDQWDADTILTTYTNTDNHPGVIKFTKKVKRLDNAIILDKQFKVPVESMGGLIPTAEEIQVKKVKKKLAKTYFVDDEAEDDSEEEEDADEEIQEDKEVKELNPRKQAKKELKEERRERRKQKKELKVAFKTHSLREVKKATVVDAGNIRPGVSVRKIY